MIVEYIRYRIEESKADDFEAAYTEAAGPLAASQHCVGYELARCVEDQASYILRIEWDSLEGHLEGFRPSPEFRAFLAKIQPYVSDIEEMQHYRTTE
ncbi:MAG: antibiotic biosynthesis monooxygenase family protein, partial [Acidimicrobiales bacterium]